MPDIAQGVLMSNAGKRPTVLIVDDESALRQMLSEAIGLEGYTIELAANGQEAIDILEKAPNIQRVMLLDLTMPVLDGAGVVRWLVEHPAIRAQTKVVLMSANHKLKTAFDLDHDAELAKPFGIDNVLALLQ